MTSTDPLLHGTDVSLQKVGDGKWSLVMQLDAVCILSRSVNTATLETTCRTVGIQVADEQLRETDKDFDACANTLPTGWELCGDQPSFKLTITGIAFAIKPHTTF